MRAEETIGRANLGEPELETLQLLEVAPPPPREKRRSPQRGEGGSARHGAPPHPAAPSRGNRGRAGGLGRRGLVARQVTPPPCAPRTVCGSAAPQLPPSLARGKGGWGAARDSFLQRDVAPAKGAPSRGQGGGRALQNEGARQPLNLSRVPARSRQPCPQLGLAACLSRQIVTTQEPARPGGEASGSCRDDLESELVRRSSREPLSPCPPPGEQRR